VLRPRELLRRQQEEWDGLARQDPLWAIISEPGARGGRWELESFFATGRSEVARLMALADGFGLPKRRHVALDVGCGVGRLTRVLGEVFDRCVAVDVSPVMVDQARLLNMDRPNLRFEVASGDALAAFEDGEFDFVCSIIVLQHLPFRSVLERAIAELCRVLRPGGALVFQLPTHVPPRHRIQARPRLYRALRRVGAPPTLLLRAGLIPISVRSLPEATVRRCVVEAGGRVEKVVTETETTGVRSATYVVSQEMS